MAKDMFGYKWDGTYWIKPDGSRITDDQAKKEVTLMASSQSRLGGHFMKKKY